MFFSFLPCSIKAVVDSSANYDCVIAVKDEGNPKAILDFVSNSLKSDKAFEKEVSCFNCDNKLTVYSPLDLDDYADVREYFKAAKKGVERAVKAECTKLLLLIPSVPKFKNAELSTVLGALCALYVPLQFREDVPDKAQRIQSLYISWTQKDKVNELINTAIMLESGLFIARDIGGGDPERMSPPNVANYVERSFTSGVIKMSIISDQDQFVKDYPLFAAVNRASRHVQRHQGRIIFMEYKPPKPSRKTLMLVGKGVTYDTGGADIKVSTFYTFTKEAHLKNIFT